MVRKSTKVDSTPSTSAKKGRKRGANQAIKNVASAKKQKLENEEKQKLEKEQSKKIENPEEVLKAAVLKKNQSLAKAAPLVTKNANDVSSDSLDTSESYTDSDVSDEKPKATEKQPSAAIETGTKKDLSSDEFESGSESESSDEETMVPVTGKEPIAEASKDQEPSNAPVANNASENRSSGDSSDEYTDGSEESDDDPSLNTPKKKPMTPTTSQAPGILFVGNLSFKIKDDDVVNFFKNVGEVVEVRLARGPDGEFKGFGHVEFATLEDAQKALLLDGDHLLNRPVNLDLARGRGASTPNIRDNKSYQKDGRSASLTAFVTGFDKSVGEDEIRSALKNHFGPCGMTTRISIPPDRNNGCLRGMAYIDFKDSNGFNKALELDGSEVNGWKLIVTEAKPKDGGGSSGGRGGGRRGGGGRFGRRGGRGGSGR